MKYLVFFLVIAAGVAGFFIGAHKGQTAIEALAALEQAAKQEKAESDRTINALEDSMVGLAAEHKNELDKLETDYKQQRAKLDEALAGKEKKIRDMTAKMSANQQEIERLRTVAGSATDPIEKQRLLERVAQLENERRNLASSLVGLKCLTAAVPDGIVGQLQGRQP